MSMNDQQEIYKVLKIYFDSIYFGNAELLRTVFCSGAILSGEVKGQFYYKTLDEYLEIVENRKSPNDLGESFAMKALSIEILAKIAFVKTHCKMLGFNYYDYLSLVHKEGRWLIVSKLFTHVD